MTRERSIGKHRMTDNEINTLSNILSEAFTSENLPGEGADRIFFMIPMLGIVGYYKEPSHLEFSDNEINQTHQTSLNFFLRGYIGEDVGHEQYCNLSHLSGYLWNILREETEKRAAGWLRRFLEENNIPFPFEGCGTGRGYRLNLPMKRITIEYGGREVDVYVFMYSSVQEKRDVYMV